MSFLNARDGSTASIALLRLQEFPGDLGFFSRFLFSHFQLIETEIRTQILIEIFYILSQLVSSLNDVLAVHFQPKVIPVTLRQVKIGEKY